MEQSEVVAPESVAVDAVVLEGGSAVVVGVSDSLLAWSGYEEHELLGRPVWDTLATGDLGAALREVHQDLDAVGGIVAGAVTAKDGTTRHGRWAQVTVASGDETSRVVMTDLGPAVAAGDEPAVGIDLDDDEPSALDRVSRGLLDTLSHELRTPVASVTGYTELLREGEGGQLTMMQRKFVAAIARNSERLSALADQLLLIGGLESRSTQLQLTELDLREVVSAARVSLAASGLERVTVTLEPGEVPLPVVADRNRLVQVVEELVVNAAKFTLGSGEVTCSARAEGSSAVIEVVDDGVGLGDDDEPSSLFLPFYRSRAVRVRGVPGAGLGLSFASAVVRGHGGEITAAAGERAGSVFTVRLPLAEPVPADESEVGASS
ncbi:sensor histidine kinase [Nocardioides sp. GXQ0305]|uniref:sensor histidine kinase n=1 Tax=Nocardioides sp. GXQ0305 TaxID=3423912 RepID=UPI003D7EAAAA